MFYFVHSSPLIYFFCSFFIFLLAGILILLPLLLGLARSSFDRTGHRDGTEQQGRYG